LEKKKCWVKLALEPPAKCLEIFAPARQQSPLDQAGLHCDVAARLVEALIDATDAVPNLKPEVPARADESLEGHSLRTVWSICNDQQVDIRMREKLAPAVAAYCEQRKSCWNAD